jgi:hypothetical protein
MTVVAITSKRKKPRAASRSSSKGKREVPQELQQHILHAFELAGGDAYLAEVARSHPAAFLSLLVKVLPLQLEGDGAGAVFQKIERVIVHPSAADAGGV